VSDAAVVEDENQTSVAEMALADSLARMEEMARERDEIAQQPDEYRKLYLLLREENERLKRGLVGQKAESCRETTRSSL
jgi:hypothetical protein